MSLGVAIHSSLEFAINSHQNRSLKNPDGDRYGPDPYSVHLLSVLSVAFEFGIVDEDILISCPLHDAIEDTHATRDEVEVRFGPRVAALVDAVSDPTGFKNRKDRKKAAYPRMLAVPGAVKLKLADRIANVRNNWNESVVDKKSPTLLGMYKKEYGGFRKTLRAQGGGDPVEQAMWEELDRLLAWRS
jgi:(p)ppGpp synthase/HD superfamily hydrolase